MARITEPEKMENIKKAMMELIVENGYGGTSIALISERAKVSPGYLYRFYSSKEKLMEELISVELGKIIEVFSSDIRTSKTVQEAGLKSVTNILMQANEDPILAKFIAYVVIDIKSASKYKEMTYKTITEIADCLIQLGRKTGEISEKITNMDVIIVSLTIPFLYTSNLLELDKNKKFTLEDAKRITEISLNALK